MTLDLQQEITDPTGFGYIEIGVCDKCMEATHLFSCSAITSGRSLCVDCWGSHFHFADIMVRIPNKEQFPVMAEELPRCQACGGFEVISKDSTKFTEAYLADKETLVTVHNRCVTSGQCETCDVEFATNRYRSWRTSQNHNLKSSHLFNDYTTIDGNSYCEQCTQQLYDENGGESNFFTCPACEDINSVDYSQTYDGEWYCSTCYEGNVYECNECGTEQWDGNGHDCLEDEDDEALIHNYTYRPTPFFFGTGQYHFGFELEVEARGNGRYEGATLVQNTLGAHAYLKDDGSLDDGFEIVTHPHTLENYHKGFNWNVLDGLKDRGYRSWNTRTCGLHVHVSRTAFGNGKDAWAYGTPPAIRSQIILQKQAHELRFMKLIYDNQRQVERISGRSNNRFATFEDKGNLVRKIKFGHQENGRYSAINTENDDTIEVRVFKGSLRKERVLSALEFVHASVEYTRDIKVTSKNHALSWLKFTGYVAENAELYPNLVTIMSESFASDDNPNESDN